MLPEPTARRGQFVVVRDLLTPEQLEAWRAGCARVLAQILSAEGIRREDGSESKYMTESGRLPHRYSFGCCSATRQLLHDPAWASMVDLPTTTPILSRIFGGEDKYCVNGAGGDLCLPGALEYQHLYEATNRVPPRLFLHALTVHRCAAGTLMAAATLAS